MQTIYKGTTPSLTLTFDTDLDLTEADSVAVTFATDYRKPLFEKTGTDLIVDEHAITMYFTQQQTLAIQSHTMLIQMNALFGTERICSDIAKLCWAENLKNEVMT